MPTRRKPTHRLSGYSSRKTAAPYESLRRELEQDQIYVKKLGQAIPRKFREIRFLEELQDSRGLKYLARHNIPGDQILNFLTWFCGELTTKRILQGFGKNPQSDPNRTFSAKMSVALLEIDQLIQNESAQKFFDDLGFKKSPEKMIGPLRLLSALITAPIKKKLKQQDALAEAFRRAPPSSMQLAQESNVRTDDQWRPLLIVTTAECDERFDSRMPTLVADLFNTPSVQSEFPNMPRLTTSQVTKFTQRKAKEQHVPALKRKQNPASKTISKQNQSHKSRLGVDTFRDE